MKTRPAATLAGTAFRAAACVALAAGLAACRGGGSPRLGLEVRAVTPEEAKAAMIAENAAVAVVRVFPATPAARAGFEPGDLVIGIDGPFVLETKERASEFAGKVAALPAGDYRFTRWRGLRAEDLPLRLP